MRVVYWARMRLAKERIIAAVEAVPGAQLTVVETIDELMPELPGADALLLADAPPDMARKVKDALSSPENTVKWMHFLTAGREGFEAVGLPDGVAVTYPAGGVAPAVAEHAMTLLLAVTRRVPAMLAEQAKRNWSRETVSANARSIEGMTMAIVGYGQIGREIARRAKGFGVHTIGLSRTARADEFLDESHGLDDLKPVLGRADIVMIAIALTDETRHLINADTIAAAKPGFILVNVARGGLVDQVALAEALVSGQIFGAGLDVVDPEPLPADDPLWEAPNLIVSPHFAGGASIESQKRLASGAAENLERLMAGEALLHQVN